MLYPDPGDDPWSDRARRRPLPHVELLDEIAAVLCEAGIRIRDMVCVGSERQGSYLCTNPACCPPEGRPVRDERTTVVDATMVGDRQRTARAPRVPGRAARATGRRRPRAAGGATGLRAGLRPSRPGLLERADRFVADLRRCDGAARDPAARTRLVATVGHLVSTIPSRDLLLRGLTVESDHRLLTVAREVLAEAVRCAEPGRAAPLAAVLAVCCWVDGDGAAAWVALDRALAADPDHSLAGLIATALQQGQPPWVWTSIMADLNVEEILASARPDPERWPA